MIKSEKNGLHEHNAHEQHGRMHDDGEHDHGHDDHSETASHNISALNAKIITVRAHSGLSGDMMLSGLAGLAELSPQDLDELVEELNIPALRGSLKIEQRSVNQIAGLGCSIELPHEHAHRNLADIRKIIADSAMPEDARDLSIKAFILLAEAEAEVHGKKTEQVTFHEVGALDSILDTCLVCRIFAMINPGRFVCSPIPLADGVIHCAHGCLPSPAPAVLRLLENVPVCGFSGQGETITPTALSLLKALGAEFGNWPEMTVKKTVISYGSKIFANAPNGAVWALGCA